jgi:hypothetical protein
MVGLQRSCHRPFSRANRYSVTIPESIKTYLPTIESIVHHTPAFGYIQPIAQALAKGRKPGRPDGSTSLLFGPLIDSNRRCGLLSCRKTAEDAGVDNLKRCVGCDEMEQYCYREHQKQDWKVHKIFCLASKRTPS